jgi:hypothetical protein
MSPQAPDGPTDEVLSTTILSLIDNPERIESLRQMLGSFNHRCRNSLNGIKMSLYLCKRQAAGPLAEYWFEFERTYQEVERLFDRLQVIYRPLALTLVRSPLGQLVNEHSASWSSWFDGKRGTLLVEPPRADPPGDFDPMYLGLGLDAFVAWRADTAFAGSQARMTWRFRDDFFELEWEEGRRAESAFAQERETGVDQGTRGKQGVDCLALPLLARIVSAHGGTLKADHDPAFVMRLRWPRFSGCDAKS